MAFQAGKIFTLGNGVKNSVVLSGPVPSKFLESSQSPIVFQRIRRASVSCSLVFTKFHTPAVPGCLKLRACHDHCHLFHSPHVCKYCFLPPMARTIRTPINTLQLQSPGGFKLPFDHRSVASRGVTARDCKTAAKSRQNYYWCFPLFSAFLDSSEHSGGGSCLTSIAMKR